MFKPSTPRIEELSKKYSDRIKELVEIFVKKTNVYIDYANVYHWSSRLGWKVDPKRLIQLLKSFDTVNEVKIYNGVLVGDTSSEDFNEDLGEWGYKAITKPVKLMRLSIDVSGIPPNSPTVLGNFIKRPLLTKLNLETIEYLNTKLKELNDQGVKFVEVRKCNFDVEIGRDMLLDYERNGIETYVLWSGDSDFADPVTQLREDSKKVHIFATARRVSVELNQTGAPIFDIQKIRNFICDSSQLQDEAKKVISK